MAPGEIWHSIAAVRWTGFAVVVAFHLGLIVLMGLAWWMLGRDQARWPVFAWGRLIRDSGSEALPLSQIGGYVLGARAVALAGIPAAFAAGSTVVDVTVELVAQLGYTLIGLGMLQSLQPDAVILVPVLAGVGVMAVLVTVFIAVQARGAGAVEQIGARGGEPVAGAVDRRVRGGAAGHRADPWPPGAAGGGGGDPSERVGAERSGDLVDAGVDGIAGFVGDRAGDRQPAVWAAQRGVHGAECGGGCRKAGWCSCAGCSGSGRMRLWRCR